jgi:hypothetical protein
MAKEEILKVGQSIKSWERKRKIEWKGSVRIHISRVE